MIWKGWITRMKAYLEYCSQQDPEKLIVLSDAFDVLCIRDGTGFETAFNELAKLQQCDIIIGAETGCDLNCFPPTTYWTLKDITAQCKRKYVNGGLMAGRAKHLAKLWDWCCASTFTEDDQVALGHYVNCFPEKVYLDIDSVLFFNDHLAQTKYVFDSKTHDIIYENKCLKPFFVHFHGLNINASVPFFNLSNGQLFDVGKNYKLIGEHINGKGEHIIDFPPDKRGFILGTSIERGVLVGFGALFLCIIIIVLIRLFKNHKKRPV
jgi:hypothetical protein